MSQSIQEVSMPKCNGTVKWRGREYASLEALVSKIYTEGFFEGALAGGQGSLGIIEEKHRSQMRRWIERVIRWAERGDMNYPEPRLDGLDDPAWKRRIAAASQARAETEVRQ